METAKPSHNYRYDDFDLDLAISGERKLTITIIDAGSKAQYYEKDVMLVNIGVNTLIKALLRDKKEIKIQFKRKNQAENDLLEVKVTVDSPFLKPVEEIIVLKKIRDVSEQETLKKTLEHLSKRVKDLRETNERTNVATYYGGALQQKSYGSGATYQNVASIRLAKGKYLITLTLLVKAQNQWIYLYFNQGQALLQNSGWYTPTNAHFIPYTVRKIYSVLNDNETVSFTTYCANSYPITIRNAVITAKPIAQ